MRCPLLAQSGHTALHCTCPLLGVKRTSRFALQMIADMTQQCLLNEINADLICGRPNGNNIAQ